MTTYGYIRTSQDQEGEQHPVLASVYRGTDDACPLRMRDSSRYPETLTLPSRAVTLADQACRPCGRTAAAGAYCSSCAAAIMARALNPFYGGRLKKSSGRSCQGSLTRPANTTFFGSAKIR